MRPARVPLATQLLALALAIGLSGPAFAQALPSSYTSASRYDAAGRLTGTIAPDPGTGAPVFAAVRNSYDGAGRLVRVEKGRLSAWQPNEIAPAAWSSFTILETVEMGYDGAGRKLREVVSGSDGAKTGVTEYGYDPAGRLRCTAVRMNPDHWAAALADACVPGPAHAVHGPDRITRNSYTLSGELATVEKAVGTAVAQVYAAYTYSPNGKPVSVTDANGNKAGMRYDGLDRQSCWIFPSKTAAGQLGGDCVVGMGDFESYGYDSNGNRTSLRKRDGSTLTFQYDSLSRMSAKAVPERAGLDPVHTRDVFYEYDLRGLQTRARFDGASGEGVTNVYDGFGQLVSSTSNMGGAARSVGNLYDPDGNRIRIIHPDESYFTYDLDGLDRPTAVRENGSAPIVQFTYDNAGRRATSGYTAVTSYAYDPAGRLQTLSHNLFGDTRDLTLGFTYNPASQIRTRSSDNDAFAWRPGENFARAYAVNGLNQYTSAGPATFTHDLNGNLASTVHPGVASTSYVYDVENRLVSASGSQNADLLYDPLGRLWQVSGGAGGVRRLVYDGDALVAEYDSAGNMPHRYIHGNEAGDDPLIWYDNFASGWRRALLTDHQGSIVQVADMYGQPVATNTYDPWGIPASTNAGRFGYTGQTWVPELGLWYYKARFYSPTTGRFLQVDPIGYDDQVNLYAYVGNDPVNKTDPSGEEGPCIFTADECGMKTTDPDRINRQVNAGRVMAVSAVIAGPGLIRAGVAGGLYAIRVMAHHRAVVVWNAAWKQAGFKSAGEVGKVVGWGSGGAGPAIARAAQIDRAAVAAMRGRNLTREVVEAAERMYRAASKVDRGVSASEKVAAARANLMRRILELW